MILTRRNMLAGAAATAALGCAPVAHAAAPMAGKQGPIQIVAYHLPFPATGFISKQGAGYEIHPA
jgi:hypothetical protein